MIKLVVDGTDMVGKNAAEIVQSLAVAIKKGVSKTLIRQFAYTQA